MKTLKPDIKKIVATVTTAGLLVTGTATVAYAADSGSGSNPPAATAPAARAAKAHPRLAAALGVVAGAIGIDRAELVKDLRAGSSVADIAKAHNVDPKTVEKAVVDAADKKLDEAVTNGKLDKDRAAKIEGRLPTRVEKLVNEPLQGKLHRVAQRIKLRHHARRAGVRIAAATIGVSAKDLVAAVKGGQSVAAVATAHGVDPQTVVKAVVDAADKKLDEAVSNGKLDADRAATIKDRLTERVTNAVNRTPKAGATTGS